MMQKTINNKRDLNIKCLLLQNDKNADTTFLHSHDEIFYSFPDILRYYLEDEMVKSTFVLSDSVLFLICEVLGVPKK